MILSIWTEKFQYSIDQPAQDRNVSPSLTGSILSGPIRMIPSLTRLADREPFEAVADQMNKVKLPVAGRVLPAVTGLLHRYKKNPL